MPTMTTPKEAEHHPALAFAFFIGAMARNRQGIDGAVGMGHSTLGIGQCSGTENHIDHAQNGFGVATHGAWPFCANDQAIGKNEVHGIKHAGVGRHIREHVFQSHITSGHRCGFGNVDGPCALRRCA